MKKLFLALVCMSVACLCVSCGTSNTFVDMSESSGFDEYDYKYFAEISYDELDNKYLNAAVSSSISSSAWDEASQIMPELLVGFFGNKTNLSRLSPTSVPAELLEDFVQFYFDVDAAHIRKALYYNKDSNCYELPPVGSVAARDKIVGAAMKDNILSISYEYYSPSDDKSVVRTGTLKLEFPNSLSRYEYKYISCDTTKFAGPYDETITPAPTAPLPPPVDDMVKAIVRTLIPTGNILTYSWESPGQIAPDDLINVCAYNNLLELPVQPLGLAISQGGEYKEPRAHSAGVEAAIQSMFDVSAEYLRIATLYESDTDSYQMLNGWGGGWAHLPMSSETSEGKTVITVGVSYDEQPPTEVGTLTVEISESGAIKYLSYVYTGE